MSRDSKIEYLVNTISHNSYLLGVVAGLDEAAAVLLDIASHRFRDGKDEQAKEIRNLSTHLSFRSKEARKMYDSVDDERTAAWQQLEKMTNSIDTGVDKENENL